MGVFNEYYAVKKFTCPKCGSADTDYCPDLFLDREYGELAVTFVCGACDNEFTGVFELSAVGGKNVYERLADARKVEFPQKNGVSDEYRRTS